MRDKNSRVIKRITRDKMTKQTNATKRSNRIKRTKRSKIVNKAKWKDIEGLTIK